MPKMYLWGNSFCKYENNSYIKLMLSYYGTHRQDGSTRGSGYNKKSVTDKDENSQRFKVAEIIMHPLFNDR